MKLTPTYISDEKDWLLTKKIHGEDGISPKHLEKPELLCDIFAERLALLHSEDFSDCPIPNHTEEYLAKASYNKCADTFDKSHFLTVGAISPLRKRGRL